MKFKSKKILSSVLALSMLLPTGITPALAANKPQDIAVEDSVNASVVNEGEIENVAQIGEKGYSTLAEAVNAAKDGDTIRLLKNIDITSTTSTSAAIAIDKNLTIDLGGNTITGYGTRVFHVKSGKLKLTGTGTVKSTNTNKNSETVNSSFGDNSSVIRVGDNNSSTDAELIVDKNVNVSTDYCYGIGYFGTNNQKVTINGAVSATGSSPAISGNGTKGYGTADVTINGNISCTGDFAIYKPEAGTLTINGTVSGKGGVQARAGITIVNEGANVTATSTEKTTVGDSKTEVSFGAFVYDTASNYPAAKPDSGITINGGNITGALTMVGDGNKISISGGTFSTEPSKDYLADEYKAVENTDKTFTVQNKSLEDYPVAIGDKGYTSLAKAVTAATDGDTITLSDDCDSLVKYQNTANNVTLNLGTHTLKGGLYYAATAGSLTIKNGTIEYNESNDAAVYVYTQGSDAKLTLGENLTVEGSTEASSNDKNHNGMLAYDGHIVVDGATIKGNYAVNIMGYENDSYLDVKSGSVEGKSFGIVTYGGAETNGKSHIDISGGTVKADNGIAISGNGTLNQNYENTDINITGGKIECDDGVGIYQPQAGKLSISGNANISATNSAVEIRSGTLDISGGTFIAKATEFSCNANGSGTTTKGAAIAVAQHTTKKDISVNISGGTFTGVKALNESNPQSNDPAPKVTMSVTDGTFNGDINSADCKSFISGGTFSTKPDAKYIATGYAAEEDNGKYVVRVPTADVVEETKTATEATATVNSSLSGTAKTEADNMQKAITGTTSGGTTTKPTVDIVKADDTNKSAENIVKSAENIETVNQRATAALKTSEYLKTEGNALVIDTSKLASGTKADDVKVVVESKVEMQVNIADCQAESNNITSVTYDVKPVVINTAKIVDTEGNTVKASGGQTDAAVELDKKEVKEVKGTVAMNLPVPKTLAESSGNTKRDTLYVKHTKENGTVYWYDAKVNKDDSNNNYTISFYNPHGFSTFEVTASKTDYKLTFNPENVSLAVGSTADINATVTKYTDTDTKGTVENNPKIEWTSSNEAVATVDNGKITANKSGTATLTATYTDGDDKYIGTVNVTVYTPSFGGGGAAAPAETHKHSLTKVEAKAATTEAEGNIEYYVCGECGKYFSDAEGNNEITKESTVIAKLTKPDEKPGENPGETVTPGQDDKPAQTIIPVKAVKNLKVTAKGKTYARVSWSKVSKAERYSVRVYRGGKRIAQNSTKNLTYKLTGLKKNTKYTIKVLAYNNQNGKKVYSNASEITVKTKK